MFVSELNIKTKNMKKLIYLFPLLMISFLSYAQENIISGIVSDTKTGEVLSGVNILVKGTTNGTYSNFDGEYSLRNLKEGQTIEFSYLGYKTKTIVASFGELDVQLKEDFESLSEVVVIGYGTQKKKEVTGAVSVVNAEVIEKLNPVRIEQALQGQVSGVNINSTSGSPGSGLNIRIRGISTNGDNRPLILVDGNPITDLSVINPNDIKSVNVLKDATAGIYGVRAANGVIIIETKTGTKATPIRFTVDSNYAFQETTKKMDLLSPIDYAKYVNQALDNNGSNPRFTLYPETGTDWQEAVFETAPMYNFNLSANGGTEKLTYAFSTSYLNQEGIVGGDKSAYKRITASTNLQYELIKDLKLSFSVIGTLSDKNILQEGNVGSVLFNGFNMDPTQLIYDKNIIGGFTQADNLTNEIINPIAQMANTFDTSQTKKISPNFGIDYSFFNNFKISSKFRMNYAEVDGRKLTPSFFYGGSKNFNADTSTYTENNDKYIDYTVDNFITYDKTFNNDHNLKLLLGYSLYKNTGEFNGKTGENVAFDDGRDVTSFDGASFSNAEKTRPRFTDEEIELEQNKFDERLLSYFTRIQYNFKEKYLFSALIRRDASTRFGPDNKAGYFPSFSLGWNISDEPFLKNNAVINGLKLRASHGILGSDKIGNDLWLSVLDGQARYAKTVPLETDSGETVDEEIILIGKAEGALGTPDIKWEQQITSNVGLDISLFDNKLLLNLDAYTKRTEDLLLQPEVAGVLGANSPGNYGGTQFRPAVNAGTVENRGFEFMVSYRDQFSKDFKFNTSFNFSTLHNEVLFVASENGFEQGGGFGISNQLISRMEAGKPLGYFYGYKTNGIYQNQAEIDALNSLAPANDQGEQFYNKGIVPGDLRFVDTNEDGQITKEDRTYLGDPIPDLIAGFNLGFSYKNIDFSSSAFASIGNDMVRDYEHRTTYLTNRGNYISDAWTSSYTNTNIPIVSSKQTLSSINFSDYFVEDASYIRIQNVQIGYTFSKSILSKINIEKLRFYVSANNLHTFTNYSGYDPSATSSGTDQKGEPIGAGIDKGFYPVAKTYIFGMNIKF